MYIIAISQPTKFLLTSWIPYSELNRSSVCMEHKRMGLNTYFFSNSPVKWCFTNVVFPVPPSSTKTSLNWTWGSPWFSQCYFQKRLCTCLTELSLLFNMLPRFVITFLPKSKHLLISWLQSPSAVILEPPKMKSITEWGIDKPLRWIQVQLACRDEFPDGRCSGASEK